MPSIECPDCHLPAASALGKMFCPHCGWNREAAEKHSRLLLRLLPVLVIVFDAPLIAYIFFGHAEMPSLAALGALAIVPAILVVLVVRGKVRIGSSGTSAAPSVKTEAAETSSNAAPGGAITGEYRALTKLPRPRPVRMSRQGRMNAAIIVISLLCFAAALVAVVVIKPVSGGGVTPPRAVVFALPFALVAVIAFVMRRSLVQQRWLLAQGEIAMARVTKQWISRNGHGIRYEFTAPNGETFSRMTTDNARQLLAGMDVPVFYDPDEPKKQVALCASFYEVVMRD
jgi:hypothetical protein